MADKRMLSKKITDHDNFTSLPASAQALYMHLCLSADDDGFCNQVNAAMYKAHAKKKDLESLIDKRYLLRFDSGVIVIKHWKMHNCIRGDRKKSTAYTAEMNMLVTTDNGSYTLALPDQAETAEAVNESPRQRAYRLSSLPYSFDYKIKKAFWGKPCPICGAIMANANEDGIATNNRIPTVQHNLPISKGGLHELGNISVICKQCNVSLRDTETESLNADEVADVWCSMSNDSQVADKCQ